MGRTLHFHYSGLGSVPGQGITVPQATLYCQNKQISRPRRYRHEGRAHVAKAVRTDRDSGVHCTIFPSTFSAALTFSNKALDREARWGSICMTPNTSTLDSF